MTRYLPAKAAICSAQMSAVNRQPGNSTRVTRASFGPASITLMRTPGAVSTNRAGCAGAADAARPITAKPSPSNAPAKSRLAITDRSP